MDYTIRKLEKNDYEQYKKLINEFRQTIFTKEDFEKVIDFMNLNSSTIIIEFDKKIIATATILYEYKFIYEIGLLAHIEQVFVKNYFRKKGFGEILLNYLYKEAEEHKCYKITLNCCDNNINFYEKMGYKKFGNQMCTYI